MSTKQICYNKRAGFDFQFLEKVEAGLALQGTEVKSLRMGRASINDAFVTIDGGEAWIHQLHIPHYSHGNINNHEEFRKKKLLLHAHQIKILAEHSRQSGLTILALSLYFKKSLAKVELVVAKAKKLHDKRQSEKDKEVKKNLQRQTWD